MATSHRWYRNTLTLAFVSAPLLVGIDSCDDNVHLGRVPHGDAGTGGGVRDASAGDPADASHGNPTDAAPADGSNGDGPAEACEDACRDTEYCKVESCGDSGGTCTKLAGACDAVYEPVCGCDGETYGNDCYAAAQGVNVASQGACETVTPCEGKCGAGEYCQTEGCGTSTGVCATKTETCTFDYTPVCGCDGQTYGNACAAAGAGANVDYQGECTISEPEFCGGIAGFTCSNPAHYCDYEAGTGCVSAEGGTIADASGYCRPLGGPVCTQEYVPVCGCDGVTYGNRCSAEAAGISVASEGACK